MDIMQKLAANEAEINALERATEIGVASALREAKAKQAGPGSTAKGSSPSPRPPWPWSRRHVSWRTPG